MPLSRPLRRRRTLALTSLIDVIFILLLFFLLTSTFTRFGELPIAAASGVGSGAETAPLFLRFGVSGLSLNGAPVTLEGLPEALAPFEPGDGAAADVLVSLDEAVTSQALIDLLATLRPVAWTSVTVLE
jgi:biopolymer transport protein ExbD